MQLIIIAIRKIFQKKMEKKYFCVFTRGVKKRNAGFKFLRWCIVIIPCKLLSLGQKQLIRYLIRGGGTSLFYCVIVLLQNSDLY